ncbi:DUF2269 domain-containing protein [Rhodoferax ferrireducens]|nr:DUF2269 domain-containing protein [Rhodoferax ferrireducens]
MNWYMTLKWLHVLSSVVLVGTGFGSAFYFFFINRTRNLVAQAEVVKLVVRADWWFTTPTVVIQPATGLLMAHLAGWPLATPWLAWSLGLFVLAGVCWLPVVWLQIQMARLAQQAMDEETVLPALYWRYTRWWEALGYPAFVAMVGVFYLMVAKPASIF